MLKDFSFTAVSQLLALAIPFILYPLLLKRLGPETYADLVVINSLAVLYAAFINWGVNVEALRIISKFRDASSTLFSSVVILKIGLTTIFLPFFIVYILTVNLPLSAIFGLLVISGQSVWISTWLYQYQQRFDFLMYFNVTGKMIQLLLVIFIVQSLNSYFLVMFFVLLFNIIMSSVIRMYLFHVKLVKSTLYIQKLFIAGFKFQVSNISQRISLQFFQLYFGYRGVIQEVLVVDFFEKISNLIRGFISSWEQVLLPRLTKGEVVLSSRGYIPWLFITFLLGSIGYFLLSPIVLRILQLDIESSDSLLFIIVLFSVILSAFTLFVYQSRLYAQGRYLVVGKMRLFSLAIMILVFLIGNARVDNNILLYVMAYTTYEIALIILFKLNDAGKVFT